MRQHLRCNLLFGLIGHFGLLKDVNISFVLYFSLSSLSIAVLIFCEETGGLVFEVTPYSCSLSREIKHTILKFLKNAKMVYKTEQNFASYNVFLSMRAVNQNKYN